MSEVLKVFEREAAAFGLTILTEPPDEHDEAFGGVVNPARKAVYVSPERGDDVRGLVGLHEVGHVATLGTDAEHEQDRVALLATKTILACPPEFCARVVAMEERAWAWAEGKLPTLDDAEREAALRRQFASLQTAGLNSYRRKQELCLGERQYVRERIKSPLLLAGMDTVQATLAALVSGCGTCPACKEKRAALGVAPDLRVEALRDLISDGLGTRLFTTVVGEIVLDQVQAASPETTWARAFVGLLPDGAASLGKYAVARELERCGITIEDVCDAYDVLSARRARMDLGAVKES